MQVNRVWLLVAALVLIDLVAALIFITAPSGGTVRGYFVHEDSLIENLTAAFYLFTFFAALLLLKNQRVSSVNSRRWLIMLSAVGLLGFLDEISFGERLFDLAMPVLGDTKIDAVHDVVELALNQAAGLGSGQKQLLVLILFCLLALAFVAILKHAGRLWGSIVTDRHLPLYVLLTGFVSLGCAALILDTGWFRFRGAVALEEFFELNAALVLLTSCLSIYEIEAAESPSERHRS